MTELEDCQDPDYVTVFSRDNSDRKHFMDTVGCIVSAEKVTGPDFVYARRAEFTEVWFKTDVDAEGLDRFGTFDFSRTECRTSHPEINATGGGETDTWHFKQIVVCAVEPSGDAIIRKGVARDATVGTVAQLGMKMANDIETINKHLWEDEDGPEGWGPWRDLTGIAPWWFTEDANGDKWVPVSVGTWDEDVRVDTKYAFGGFRHDSDYLAIVNLSRLQDTAMLDLLLSKSDHVLYVTDITVAIGVGRPGRPAAIVEVSGSAETLLHEWGHNAGLDYHANMANHDCWPNDKPGYPLNVMAPSGNGQWYIRRGCWHIDDDDCDTMIQYDQVNAYETED
ncbi:MAG: hypothetical protein GY851_34005 [bacterium]|nr:hypothetical protein [bacterium]